ncbi:MAG: hypothetical protein RI967_2434 [Planctomycetota bacterium]
MPHQASSHVGVVRALMATGRLGEAVEAADEGLRRHPKDPSLGLLRGVLDHRFGRSDAAIARLESLFRSAPPNAREVAIALAEALHRAGRREAFARFVQTEAGWQGDERAAIFLARLDAEGDAAKAIDDLRRLACDGRESTTRRIAGFEAVRLLDRLGRYREAFELATAVHRDTTPPFDVFAFEEEVVAEERMLGKAEHAIPRLGPDASDLAFVVGMPRSGTTLLEQMLDRHPEVRGIGEYEGVFTLHQELVSRGIWPDRLRALAAPDATALAADYRARVPERGGAAGRVSFDKTLHAWRLLPAVAAVFPGASLVHIERDPRDTAISMFLSNFHPRSWGFTRDLASIRRVIALERRIVRPMLEAFARLDGAPRGVSVVYEELVDHPEREIRRVLDAMRLPFDPAVLAPEQNTRTVLTLSHEQVRRPINRTSIGRWRNYGWAFEEGWEGLARG